MAEGGERPRFAQTSRSLLRVTVLRAVDDLVREHPWPSVSMARIAGAAGVSRQTLYNEFGTRGDLARAYVLWAADDFLDEIERAVHAHVDDLEAALLAAFELFLEVAGEHPLVRSLVATADADDLRTLVATPAGVPLIAAASSRLTAIITDTWPTLPVTGSAAVADTLVRLAISHLTVPTGTPTEAAAAVGLVAQPFLARFAALAAHPDSDPAAS